MSLSYTPLIYSNQKKYDEVSLPDPSKSIIEITTDKNSSSHPTTINAEESVNSKLPSVFSHLSTFFEAKHRKSLFGRARTLKRKDKIKFILLVILMIICGVCTDFLGRFNYQSLTELQDHKNIYWIIWFVWLLTAAHDGISFLTIIYGWEDGEQWRKMKSEWKKFWFNIFISGTLTLLNGSGIYLAFVYLPASVASLVKNAIQILFSALFRKWIQKKTPTVVQLFGIVLVVIGLICVCVASGLHDHYMDTMIGINALLISAFCGSVRNYYEQILCCDMNFNPYFVVGMREIPTFFWLVVTGICLYFLQPIRQPASSFFYFVFSKKAFVIGFVLFIIAVCAKNVTQMKVIESSSALTRNWAIQLVPFGVWITSIVFYYFINEQYENIKYGEELDFYSIPQLGGFIFVLFGSWCYMAVPRQKYIAAVSIQTTNIAGTSEVNELGQEILFTRGSGASLMPFPEL